jgi:hypothetical protein
MDLVAADLDAGPRLLIDVTVANPLRTRRRSQQLTEGLRRG